MRYTLTFVDRSGTVRHQLTARTFATIDEARAYLQVFLDAGQLPKVYTQQQIDSMRVTAVETWDNYQAKDALFDVDDYVEMTS